MLIISLLAQYHKDINNDHFNFHFLVPTVPSDGLLEAIGK